MIYVTHNYKDIHNKHLTYSSPYIFNRFNAGDLNVPQCKKNRTNLTLAISKSDLNVPHVLHVGHIPHALHVGKVT